MLSSHDIYYKLLKDNGRACIGVRCEDCDSELRVHEPMVRKYTDKVKLLEEKWNARAEVPEPVEEKYYITIHKVKQMGGKIVEAGGEITQITYADRYNAVNTFSEMIDMIEGME